MTGVFVATFLIVLRGMPRGQVQPADDQEAAAHAGTREDRLAV